MLLTLSNVSKSYRTAEGPIAVLRGIDLSVDAAQSVALTGESGSGKSTLLHLAGGLDRADAGSIIVNGEDITALDEADAPATGARLSGWCFNSSTLFLPSASQTILPFMRSLPTATMRDWARELTETLGLGGAPQSLSRAIIGRAAATRGDRPAHLRHAPRWFWPMSRPAIWMRQPAKWCST